MKILTTMCPLVPWNLNFNSFTLFGPFWLIFDLIPSWTTLPFWFGLFLMTCDPLFPLWNKKRWFRKRLLTVICLFSIQCWCCFPTLGFFPMNCTCWLLDTNTPWGLRSFLGLLWRNTIILDFGFLGPFPSFGYFQFQNCNVSVWKHFQNYIWLLLLTDLVLSCLEFPLGGPKWWIGLITLGDFLLPFC